MNETSKEKEIDIIIPAYNAVESLELTLMSICIQNIVNKVNVIIIDDNSSCSYDELINKYNKFMSINLINCNENGGPGKARHIGVEASTAKYITFIDADDVFATSTALFTLYNEMEKDDKLNIIAGIFQEEIRDDKDNFVGYMDHRNDLTWMFGKMYRKSFLDKYNINFNDSRANEDSGFNGLCLLCAEQGEIKYIERLVYCWNYNKNSITKNNDYSYTGLNGFIHNHIWSIHKAISAGAKEEVILSHSVNIISLLYIYYQALIRENRTQEQLNVYLSWVINYYRDVYIQLRPKISPETFTQCYLNTMKQHEDNLKGFIPTISIFTFLDVIDKQMLDSLKFKRAFDEKGSLLGYVKNNISSPTMEDIIDTEQLDEFKKTNKVLF